MMNYALNLSEDGRVLSVTFEEYALPGAVIIEELPSGDLYEFRYVNGEFIHDPMPEPEQPEPEATTEDILNVLLGVM